MPPLEESKGSGGTGIADVVSPDYGLEDAWCGSLCGLTGNYGSTDPLIDMYAGYISIVGNDGQIGTIDDA